MTLSATLNAGWASVALERAGGEDPERVTAVGGAPAHVVDRRGGSRDPVGERPCLAERRADEQRARGRRAERGSQLLPAERASEHTAITIALRGPIFMNVCGSPDGVTQTAVISSSGASTVRLTPVTKSPRATRRLPRTEEHSTSAPSIRSGGRASPAGEAVARLPPIVPRLRICGDPTVRAASASAGRSSASSPAISSE